MAFKVFKLGDICGIGFVLFARRKFQKTYSRKIYNPVVGYICKHTRSCTPCIRTPHRGESETHICLKMGGHVVQSRDLFAPPTSTPDQA
jgi:hypothetical protein